MTECARSHSRKPRSFVPGARRCLVPGSTCSQSSMAPEPRAGAQAGAGRARCSSSIQAPRLAFRNAAAAVPPRVGDVSCAGVPDLCAINADLSTQRAHDIQPPGSVGKCAASFLAAQRRQCRRHQTRRQIRRQLPPVTPDDPVLVAAVGRAVHRVVCRVPCAVRRVSRVVPGRRQWHAHRHTRRTAQRHGPRERHRPSALGAEAIRSTGHQRGRITLTRADNRSTLSPAQPAQPARLADLNLTTRRKGHA